MKQKNVSIAEIGRYSAHSEEISCRDLERGFSPVAVTDLDCRESESSRDTSAIKASPSAGLTRYPCAPDARARALSVSYAAPEKKRTGVCWSNSLNCSHKLTPEVPGIQLSIT